MKKLSIKTINTQTLQKLLFTFLVGGTIITGVYYLSMVLQQPALAAILGAVPISLICCYFLTNKKNLNCYANNSMIVLMITVFCLGILTFLLKLSESQSYQSILLIITVTLAIWLLLQWCQYRIVEKYYPKIHRI